MAKAIEITPAMIARAEELAAEGLPQSSIAAGLGVSHATFYKWVDLAKTGTGDDSHVEFLDAIQRGTLRGEQQLLGFIRAKAAEGESRDAQWLLTHSPRWRNTWSDAAATRREVQRTVSEVVAAIEATPGLPVEQRRAVLLSLAARGIGADPAT
jgi:transposase-like protein